MQGASTLSAIVYNQVRPDDETGTYDPDARCVRTVGHREGDLEYTGVRFDWTNVCGVTPTGQYYTMRCASG